VRFRIHASTRRWWIYASTVHARTGLHACSGRVQPRWCLSVWVRDFVQVSVASPSHSTCNSTARRLLLHLLLLLTGSISCRFDSASPGAGYTPGAEAHSPVAPAYSPSSAPYSPSTAEGSTPGIAPWIRPGVCVTLTKVCGYRSTRSWCTVSVLPFLAHDHNFLTTGTRRPGGQSWCY
jgi:hypothetical protein